MKPARWVTEEAAPWLVGSSVIRTPAPLSLIMTRRNIPSQVGIVGEQLASLGFTRLVISPFQRCLETAKQLNVKLQLPYASWQIDSEVCEASDCVCVVGHVALEDISLATGVLPCVHESHARTKLNGLQCSMKQVLSPKTLVGSQLEPPVGLAKDWMWGQGNLRAALAQVLGDEGAPPAAQPCQGDAAAMHYNPAAIRILQATTHVSARCSRC